MVRKWIKGAIKRPGRVRAMTGTKPGKKVPVAKINKKIASIKRRQTTSKGTLTRTGRSAVSALNLAKRLKKMSKR